MIPPAIRFHPTARRCGSGCVIAGLLALALLPRTGRAQAAEPARPATGHSSQNALLISGYGLGGRVPDYYRYLGTGVGLARRNRWGYADADYDSDFTLGLRLGIGRQFDGRVSGPQTLWGLNPYVAVDGRFFGAALGVWVGQLGDFRAEGQRPGRLIPQLRARAGQLTGWYGRLSYADELGGLGNPLLHLGGGYGGLLNGRLRLGTGVAVPTLARPGQEIGLYAEAGIRTSFGEFGAYGQPPLRAGAPGQLGLQLCLSGLAE
ncbi:hypothetical protein [Hymenobacter amundsenii]|uniref:hypothetical protein n=1 Tax=Hymenobacter amundsenii TaxID=2006685 RepID=UPI000F8490AD|nr:hypothetical protein [Hymenobacter amundsenii]